MGLHRHGPAQYLDITPTNYLSQVTSTTGLYYQSVMAELIADTELTMDGTYHYPVELIFQAHLHMYSLIHTDSLAQQRKLLCLKVFAMHSQCKVFLHLNYIHKISLDKVEYNQQNNTPTENNGESSSA
jgi:hypothetical protein